MADVISFPSFAMSQIDSAAQVAAVDRMRRESAAHRDQMLAFQKQLSSDHEAARFFKQEARSALKLYRAACLLLGWIATEPPGDCPFVKPKDWPIELCDAVQSACGRAWLHG